MFTYTHGNLLESQAEALVNTVNTVGIMGKGIALMFKDAFPDNFRAYAKACKAGQVNVGNIFATEQQDLMRNPKWIINFPTKQHWRNPSKIEWIDAGLASLRSFIIEKSIHSIALPPLGSGNGGLDWRDVRPRIEAMLGPLKDVAVTVYEPGPAFQNVAKRKGVEELTPARALIAELVRRYGMLDMDCTVLEIQKLAYLLERMIDKSGLPNPLKLEFQAAPFGPYAAKLPHLLDDLDGFYLHSDKRVMDAKPLDAIWFDPGRKSELAAYLNSSKAEIYLSALEATAKLIEGFESPFGMELLATIDWLLKEGTPVHARAMRCELANWPGGEQPAQRKLRLFDERVINIALERLVPSAMKPAEPALRG